MLNKIRLFLLLLLVSNHLFAQRAWTLTAAVDTALQNNYGIAISKNNLQVAANNDNAGASGMLPVVTATGSVSRASNDIRQETSAGAVTSNTGVRSDTYNGRVALSWTIFDGFKMFATRDKLERWHEVGEQELKRTLLQTISDVNLLYAELQMRQEAYRSAMAAVGYAEARKYIAAHKVDLGNAAKTELLAASVDYADKLNERDNAGMELKSVIIAFNRLLQLSPADSAVATDSLSAESLPDLNQLLSVVDTGNIDLRERLLMDKIAADEIKEQKSYYYPQLSLDAGYTYNRNATAKGFFLENRTQGPSAGLSLKWTLFNGMYQQRMVKNARLAAETAQLETKQVKSGVQASVYDSWQQLAVAIGNATRMAGAEKDARENLDIMLERYRLKESNVLELKDAQNAWELSRLKLLQALYLSKMATVRLSFLSGKLK